MAEVPPGPSALPASPAEIIPFPGVGCAIPGEGGERGCGRGDAAIPGVGQQQQVSEGKGTSKATQNHLYSHPAVHHFHTQTQQQQQLNGLINAAEDGLACTHHSRLHSHHHHPAHRPSDSPGALTEHRDGTGGARAGAQEGSNFGDINNSGCQGQHCPPQNHSYSNNNHSMNSMLTLSEEASWRGDRARTEPRPSPADPPAVAGLGTPGAGVELEAALDGSYTVEAAVSEMARVVLNSSGGEQGEDEEPIQYVRYESELQMPDIMRLITKDLSEPYSIYTYRYFIHNWPKLCFLAMVREECVGAIVCKLDMHKKMFRRGYIAMLAVDSKYRRKGIGTNLVKKAIYAMVDGDCDEVVLETEITNKSALKLYENLGFVRDKRLFRYYLNGVDALRLKLWLR
ncbi:N-alpha-acetyltransferase 30 [Lepisosteus oculatus]|uniref:N-alpha-acetyltransferase 30 n=1 Tax=Lepisosteus oculatus TaxID=7918 RepID=W5MZ73_LEPOC|nr:PREDICTED: N-alpha-acetyltransferase 30 [Lepisosteus oculatus]